jgi:cytochrome c-type protein NapB
MVLAALAACGCDLQSAGDGQSRLAVTSASVRSARRLYDGAPPVIPHAPLNISCVQCHTETGKEAPPLGFAPANPHAQTAGVGEKAHCVQCHVFQPNAFVGRPQTFTRAERLFPGAPPVMPHSPFMRENCNSCHSGPVARKEIRCSHPLRANCRQCHVPAVALDEPALASVAE